MSVAQENLKEIVERIKTLPWNLEPRAENVRRIKNILDSLQPKPGYGKWLGQVIEDLLTPEEEEDDDYRMAQEDDRLG